MFRLLQLVLFMFPFTLKAQLSYQLDQSIPVRNLDNDPIPMPWAGGLNAAHYNKMDINGDGREDLVLFDRTADKVLTYLNDNNRYRYAPDFENSFPDDITNWLLLRDVNCDGKKDIFTGNNLGIKVYLNITSGNGLPQWQHFLFSSGGSGGKSQVLLTKGFAGRINLQLQFDDLPAIVDADGDGDLDIFNVRFVGNGTVEYHQNVSMERYGTCDSLEFERVTQKWGDFTECSCGNFAFNGATCPPLTGGRTQHAGGKSLLALDADGDTKMDLLFSEASCTNLFFLKNEGTISSPAISTGAPFPSNVPASFYLFPAAFFEDLDFDNVKDLIVIPNVFSKTLIETDFGRSNWLYKNTGSNTSPSFTFTQRNFLQDQMIDVGDNSVPAFIDFDGDGDYDLFVSQNSSDNIASTIRLYENKGTATAPEFQLINEDIWGFSTSSFYNVKIQFTDLNRDGSQDLALTATSFITGLTKLYFVPGNGSGVIDFTGQSIQSTEFSIAFSENVYINDVDRDGFPDLLVGKANGSLEFWKNRGGVSLGFDLVDDSYLGLGSTVLRQNISCMVADLDGDGKSDLAYGDQNGKLYIISGFRDAADASGAATNIVFNELSQEFQSRNLGGRIWPTSVNLFGSTRPAIVTGNVLGGLYILRNAEGLALPEDVVIELFPNPVSRQQTMTIRTDRPAFLQTYSVLGQEMTPSSYLLANEEYTYNVSNLSAGIYILRFTVDKKSFTRRIVVY